MGLKKTLLIALGIGMLCLCLEALPIPTMDTEDAVAGFSKSMAMTWIVWMDFLLAFAAIIVMDDIVKKVTQWALALSLGTLSLWIVGLLYRTPVWLTWWNFAFGVAFLAVAILLPVGPSRKKILHRGENKTREAA